MKAVLPVLILILSSFLLLKKSKLSQEENHSFTGAWELMSQNGQVVADRRIRIITSGYFCDGDFSTFDKRFNGATAGTYKVEDGKLKETYLVNSSDPDLVGTTEIFDYTIVGNSLQKSGHRRGRKLLETWRVVKEEHVHKMNGTWALGIGSTPSSDQSRKSWKLLSKDRFQWIYFDINTGEYFGTMGGYYDVTDSTYTEHYEFYPQDTSKVGTSTTFNMELDNDGWHLWGKNSNSAKILWVQIDKVITN